jgi:hypothetical protein
MSGQWSFVAAAYALTALLTLAVLGSSWRAMCRAERHADAIRRGRA